MEKYRHIVRKPETPGEPLTGAQAIHQFIEQGEPVTALCGHEFIPETLMPDGPLCRGCECVFIIDEMPRMYAHHPEGQEASESIIMYKLTLQTLAQPILDAIRDSYKEAGDH